MLAGNTGEYEGTLKELDVAAIENEELVDGVEARLANLRDITDGTRRSKPADDQEELDESTPEGEEEEKDDDKDDDQADDQEESTPEDKTGDKEDDKEGEVLSDAFLRAAVHRGWKEEDAKAYHEKDPEAANSLFQNLLIDVNKASGEWAALGKAKLEAERKAIEIATTTATPAEKPAFKGIDVDKLAKEYDLDDNAAAIIRAQNEQLEGLAKLVIPPDVTQPRTIATASATPAGPDPNVELEIENFFNSEGLKPFSEFYGGLKLGQNWDDLSGGQKDNRWKVLTQADYLMAGAECAGQSMDAVTALERAHMMVSEPIREQAIRDQIKGEATKRKKSMTLRPSDSKRSANSISDVGGGEQKPRTREELVESVGEKLDKVFNR
jgi:hypothetical protein